MWIIYFLFFNRTLTGCVTQMSTQSQKFKERKEHFFLALVTPGLFNYSTKSIFREKHPTKMPLYTRIQRFISQLKVCTYLKGYVR